MSKYNLIRGEAFVSGECVSVIEDSGFTNVELVIAKVLMSMHDDVPTHRGSVPLCAWLARQAFPSYFQVADSIDGRKRAIQIERMEILAIIGIIVLGLIIFTSVGILGLLFDVFIV